MKENMKKGKVWKVAFLAMLCVLCVTGFSKNILCSNAKDSSGSKTEQPFVIEVTSGFQNVARVGTDMVTKVTVTNQGEDFRGMVQVLLPISEGDNVMYENDISIAAGETKTISVPMHINAYTRKLVVRITDEQEKIIVKKRVKIDLTISRAPMKLVGVLTDEKDRLGYWEGDTTKVFYLSEKDMPELKEGLDTLDILIINDFDTKKLSKKQYQVLKQWVNQGGTLVIGTGSNVNRTLSIFEDDFLTGKVGKVGKDNKAEISFDNAEVFEDSKNDITMFQSKKQLGNIFVFTTDMGVDYARWKEIGSTYAKMVFAHMEEHSQNGDDGGGYSSSYGTSLTDKGKLPSVKNYAIVLIIYVILVSWVLYFVLRIKDKLEWTWVCVPALSLVFAVIVYGMGAVTRVTEPFITYVRTVEWMGEGKDTGTGNIRVSVTSPYNEKYSVAVPKGLTAYGRGGNDDYFEESETDFNSYRIGFRQSGEQQIVTMNNFGAFETADLVVEEQTSMEGTYQSDITCDQYRFKGTFTNKTGKTIKGAVFVADGRLYRLGDIKNGETITISDKLYNLMTFATAGFLYLDEYLDHAKLFDISFDMNGQPGSLEKKRYQKALEYYFSNSGISSIMDGKVVGVIDSGDADEDMSKSWGMDCSGITMSVFPVDINYTNQDGEQFVSDLYYYGSVTGGDVIQDEHVAYEKELKVEYSLKENETLTGLYYLAKNNKITYASTYYGDEFDGEIMAYNYETKKYEKIFDGGKAGKVTKLKRFVGEDNTVLLKYKTKGDGGWNIPVISATKEVK